MLKWRTIHSAENWVDDVENFGSPPKMHRGDKNERERDRSGAQEWRPSLQVCDYSQGRNQTIGIEEWFKKSNWRENMFLGWTIKRID